MVLGVVLEYGAAEGVYRGYVHEFSVKAHTVEESCLEFICSLLCKGYDQYVLWWDMLPLNKVCDPLNKDPCLPGPRPRYMMIGPLVFLTAFFWFSVHASPFLQSDPVIVS